MPTYEYLCESCGHKFEQFQGITAKPIRKCPKCGERSLKRLMGTGAGVIFKGPGFYQTDYRSESYKKAEKSEKGKPEKDVKKDTSAEKRESKSSEETKGDTSKKKTA